MKTLSAMALLLLAGISAHSQDWSGTIYKIGVIYPGFYVTNTGDTVNGYFMHGNQVENQQKCQYYKNETDHKPTSTFKPEDIRSYKVADKLYRSIHYSGGLLEKPLRFNLVIKDGGISEFTFYSETWERNADGTLKSDDVFFKANDPANPKPITLQDFGFGFAKKMSAFVADDAELSKKVSDKEKGYGMLNLLDIIDEYNKWYTTK
ncbi:MAG: hypothetical protein HY064_05150 [Bacteroidetes bacterium]|nr:hypothetical protein [Bacteroidota bacterium]